MPGPSLHLTASSKLMSHDDADAHGDGDGDDDDEQQKKGNSPKIVGVCRMTVEKK